MLLDRTGLRKRAVVSVREEIADQYRLLREADPRILHGLPSVLEEIAARAERDRWHPTALRRIFTSSEALAPSVRLSLERSLGAPVIDHYGAAEAFIGWECECQSGFHINTSNVFVEIVDDEGNEVPPGTVGRVVITTLDNPAMPLIRYAIGDMAIAGDGTTCPCGRPGPILRQVIGRQVPLLHIQGGSVSPWGVIGRLGELEFVGQFQLVQPGPDELVVGIRCREEHQRIDEAAIRALVREELGEHVEVDVKEVTHSGRVAPGKSVHTLSAPAVGGSDA